MIRAASVAVGVTVGMTDPGGVLRGLVRPQLPERPGTGAAGLMEEPDHPRQAGVSRHRPAVRPVRTNPVTSTSGQGVNAWPCWQTWSSSPVGVDTHKHTHTAAVVVAATGAVIEQVTVPAAPAGYRQLLTLVSQQPGQRVWAIEGTGGYGAGLTRFLQGQAEQVVELDRPKRTARRHGAKSDALDAIRAAREALGREQLAQPRAAGHRAALSVRLAARRSAIQATTDAQRQLHALVVAAPDTLRGRLRDLTTPRLVSSCARLRQRADGTLRPLPPRTACAPWPAASNS